MAGLKDGFTYFRDLSNVPSTDGIVSGHKAMFTLNEGVFVMDSEGNSVRLDDYQLIHDVSGALAASISAHSAVVYRGRFDLDTNNYVYTVPHSQVVIDNTSPLVTLTSPTNTSVLYVTAIRNRTTTSFDVVLSDVPNDPGYSINWLLIGEAILSGGGGGGTPSGTASPDLIGTGTRLISAQQSILPTISGAFDLGSSIRPWRDIYLSGNTMYMNGIPIHLEGNRLKVDDLYVATTNSPDASAADLSLYATIDTVASNTSMLLGMIGTKASTTSVQTTAGNLIVLTAASSANALAQADANRSNADALLTPLTTTSALTGSLVTLTSASSANALAQANATRVSSESLLTPLSTTAALTGSLVTLSAASSANALAQANLGSYATVTSLQTTAGNLFVVSAATSANALTQANAARVSSEALLTPLTTTSALTGSLVAFTSAASANAVAQSNLTNYALVTSVQTTAGNLQSQITNLNAGVGYLASVTGGFALTSALGSYATVTSLQTSAGNLQAQIATKANDSAVVHNTGNETIAGDKSFSNTVTVNGNLVVNGTTTSVTSQNLLVADNMIEVNVGGTKPIAAGHAGMQVNRGAIAGDAYRFVFEEARSGFTVGLSGNTQLVATRQDTPIVAGVAYWDDSNYRFNTSSALTSASLVTAQIQAARADAAVGYLASITGSLGTTTVTFAASANALAQANGARVTSEALLTPLTTTAGLTGSLVTLSSAASANALAQVNIGSYATVTSLQTSAGNLQAQIAADRANMGYLASVTGGFALVTSLQTSAGNLQAQITSDKVAIGYLASVTGGFALTSALGSYATVTSLQTSAGNLQAQIAADKVAIGYLASVTGGFALVTSLQTSAGNLQAQIATKANTSALSSYALVTSLQTTAGNLFVVSSATSANALAQADASRTLADALLTPLTTTAGLTGSLVTLTYAASANAFNQVGTLLTGYEPSIGYTPVNRAGDTITGTLNISGDVGFALTPSISGKLIGNTAMTTYYVQTGSFVDPGGDNGDVVYVV